MRTRKAVRLAKFIDRMAVERSVYLAGHLAAPGCLPLSEMRLLRAERDLLIEVAMELRRLAAKQGARK